ITRLMGALLLTHSTMSGNCSDALPVAARFLLRLPLSRDRDSGFNFGAALLCPCHTVNVLLAEHKPPKISGRGNRFRLKPYNRNSSGVKPCILLCVPTSRGLSVVRPIVELHDTLDRCVRIADYKICTQSIVTIQNRHTSRHVPYFHEPAKLNLREDKLFRKRFDQPTKKLSLELRHYGSCVYRPCRIHLVLLPQRGGSDHAHDQNHHQSKH